MADAPPPITQARPRASSADGGLVGFLRALNALFAVLLALPVRFYRRVISPALPPACRFVPSCSSYALEALATHGGLRGGWLTLRRLSRCHPLGGSGLDPVPAKATPSSKAVSTTGPDASIR